MLAIFVVFCKLNSTDSKLLCLERTFPEHNSLSFTHVSNGGKLRAKLSLMLTMLLLKKNLYPMMMMMMMMMMMTLRTIDEDKLETPFP